MVIIKGIILISIFLVTSLLGIMFANKYKARVNDLKSIKSALNIFKTKIEYTYEPLPQIFSEIGTEFTEEIRKNFQNSKQQNARHVSRRGMGICHKKF